MAGELLRPGVEVIQTFRSPSPTFARPALVPCVVGPAFEVLNVLNTDGTINSKAKYGAYTQLGKTITQLEFPDPRDNVDELDVLEDKIRPFMLMGGNLFELLMNPGESFLATSHGSSKAAMKSAAFGVGLSLGGKVLVIAMDQPARLDTSADITITFTGTTLTAAQAADQINSAVGSAVATVVDTDKVQLSSLTYGAMSSVTVRGGGSANSVLELGYDTGLQREERVEGSGWRGQDDNNNDTTTPWVEFYQGDFLVNGTASAFVAKAGLIGTETATYTSAKASAVTFGDSGTIPLRVGDYFYADGVKVKSAEVTKVEAGRFRLGTINTALSVADSNGRYITKVYNSVEVATLFDSNPFAPKYVYFSANGLQSSTSAAVAASVTGTVSGAAATQGVVTGVGAGAGPFTLTGLKLHYVLTVDGVETDAEFTFTNSYANMAAVAAAIAITGITASDAAGQLRLTTVAYGRLQAVTVKSDGTVNSTLGFSTLSDTTGTGKDVEFVDISAMITSGVQTVPTTTLDTTTLEIEISSDSGATYPVVKSHTFSGEKASVAAIVSDLSGDVGFVGTVLTVIDNGTTFSIKSVATGSATVIRVKSTATATGAGKLNLTLGQSDQGEENLAGQALSFRFDNNPHLYQVVFSANSLDVCIEELNTAVGAVVASKAGTDDRLKLTSPLKGAASKVAVLTGLAATAFGMSSTPAVGSGRPFPNAYLDGTNALVVGSQILRDQVTGYPLDFSSNTGSLYVQYKALRKDVSPVANIAGVLRIPDQATLESVLDPLTEDNPLGLATFLTMLNAPSLEVKCLGIDEVTAAAPEGTSAAYARAASLLESEEVYALAPLTQDEVIHGLWMTHALAMSEPEQAGERIVLFNKKMPDRKNPSIAASGTQSNSTATANQMLLDVNPSSGLVALGLNPADPFTAAQGVYMEFEVGGELRRYNVSSVSGSLANFRVVFATGENDDAFYSTVTLDVSVVNAAWNLKVRGASVIIPGSSPPRPDYSLISETVAGANESFKNRRAFSVFPDVIKTTVSGVEKSLPGYYACAAIAGMVASQPPQQGFTNFPITGLTGVVGTEKFNKKQLNIMAGGGTYILNQDVPGGAVTCRHQLSTDLTSIETRELSITKVVDFVAKFLRLGVRKFIGVQNINEGLLDTLGTTVQGMLKFAEENGVLNGSNLNNIAQDTDQPDTVLLDVTLDVPFPCNYIRLTLVV